VQVPVEVTSFLLNEKRTEITKIELKQRTTVLLVPNKHLETPNYKLERLRHDDPRLENLQASYTMIEEPDDEVAISRREKTKAKQEPVIKGVLPDQPAPVAPPPAPVVAAPVAVAPVAAPAPVAKAAAGGGFFGWIKSLFGGGDAPAAETKPASTVGTAGAQRPSEGRDGQGNREGRGQRGGRGGERGERGNRNGGKPGEGRGGRGEARAEGARGEARPEGAREGGRGDRADRGEGRGDKRRDGQRPDGNRRGNAQRGDEVETALPLAAAGGEQRPESRRQRAPMERDVSLEASEAKSLLAEGQEGTEPSEGQDAAGNDAERGRRRRRRGGRGREDGRAEGEAGGENAAPDESGQGSTEAGTDVDRDAAPRDDERQGERDGDGGRRRQRGGRGRRERTEGDEAQTPVGQDQPAGQDEAVAPAAVDEALQPAAVAAPVAPLMAAAVPVAAPAPVPAPAPAAPVRVEPFVLALDELQRIAEGAGLSWVNSNADKIAAAQAAIAAEPKAVHVPRERPPVVVVDEGPLVLVETKKDLSQLTLPFDPANQARPS
jgi:ribonuclease E